MFSCLACETMFPDMCNDCMETVMMDITEANNDAKLYEEFLSHNRIVIATGDDFPLELMYGQLSSVSVR